MCQWFSIQNFRKSHASYLFDIYELPSFQVTRSDAESALNRRCQGNSLRDCKYLVRFQYRIDSLLSLAMLTAPASITQSVASNRLALESRVQVLTVTANRLIVRSMYVATMIRGPRFDADSGARGAEESIVSWRSALKRYG